MPFTAYTNFGYDAGLKALSEGVDSFVKRRSLAALGEMIDAGDFSGAAKAAFNSGDASTALAVLKLSEAQKDRTASEKASANLGGWLTGNGEGQAPFRAPGTSSPSSAPAPVAAPSRADGQSPFERQAFEYFRGQGHSPQAAAGIVGNLVAESGMNPRR